MEKPNKNCKNVKIRKGIKIWQLIEKITMAILTTYIGTTLIDIMKDDLNIDEKEKIILKEHKLY